MTDEAAQHGRLADGFAGHGCTRHGAGACVSQDDPTIHTNTIEGDFSVFKRGMKGVYRRGGKKHLHRHVAGFDFRCNECEATDGERAAFALAGAKGKRPT